MPLIAVLGGGQLGQMLGLAGISLGCQFLFLDSSIEAPASSVGQLFDGHFNDERSLDLIAQIEPDCVTFESENIPSFALEYMGGKGIPAYPGTQSLLCSQDRITEKEFFGSLGIQVAPWAPVLSLDDIEHAVSKVGFPSILKTTRFGYDGKGQWRVATEIELRAAIKEVAGQACVLEGLVKFERELSIVGVRGRDGDMKVYPLVENVHHDGILARTTAPAINVSASLQAVASALCGDVMRRLNHVGVLTVELFETSADGLIANEMAPRVHNSGHWTIEGAVTSQFENHIRAICGWPLGDTSPRGRSVMLNCIGEIPAAADIAALPGAHMHDYLKSPRPGRKLGHITVTEQDAGPAFEDTVDKVAKLAGI